MAMLKIHSRRVSAKHSESAVWKTDTDEFWQMPNACTCSQIKVREYAQGLCELASIQDADNQLNVAFICISLLPGLLTDYKERLTFKNIKKQ